MVVQKVTGMREEGISMSRRHSIVRHQANYFYVPLEDDFLAMYDKIAKELDPEKIQQGKSKSASSDCKAMIAAILEGWMNSKRSSAKGEEDLYSYFSIDQLVQQLRGRYKRSVIIQCLGEMEVEGTYTDPQTGDTHTGTIKKRPYLQNMYGYVLNLPVVQTLIDALPEQSPYDIKARPILGRPKKSSPKKDGIISEESSPEINGFKMDGIPEEKSSPKKDGISVKQSKNGLINEKSSPKKDTPFYTQNSNTQNSNNTEGTNVGSERIQVTKPEPDSLALSLTSSSLSSQVIPNVEKLSPIENVTPVEAPASTHLEPPVRSMGDYSEAQLRKLSEIELYALLTPNQKEILARWRSLFNAPIKLDGKLARALHDLEPYNPSADTLEQIRKYCFTIDRATDAFPKGYYKTKGVKLWDVVEHYADWVQTQELAAPAPKKRKMTDAERNALPY
jgi:hypothetical protein